MSWTDTLIFFALITTIIVAAALGGISLGMLVFLRKF
jgi:hypothetical protein